MNRGAASTIAAVAALVALLAACTSDDSSVPTAYDLGAIERFAPESVTSYLVYEREGNLQPVASDFSGVDLAALPDNAVLFHVVRLDDGGVRALYAKDPHLGCWVPWRPDFEFEGRRGWFRNPCHGETYDITGRRIPGPSPRDLDRFPVRVEGGRVIVRVVFDELIPGESHVQPPGAGTPEPAATTVARESPAGVLAFAAGGTIYTVRADGTGLTEVITGTREPAPDAPAPAIASAWAATPALSSDGSLLLFTRDFDLWVANADGSDQRLLANVGGWQPAPGASNFSLGAQSVAWSPDGRRIAYALARIGGSGVNQLWTLELPSMRRELIAETRAFLAPLWLDADRAGFFEGNTLHVFDAASGNELDPLDLGAFGGAAHVGAVADGAWLSGPFTGEGAIRYGPAGTAEVVASGVSPVLSPDGEWLAYFAGDRLRIAALDGSADRELLDAGALGGRDRHHASGCSTGGDSGCGYRPPQVSWVAERAAIRPPPPTGVAEVDAVFRAVREGDIDALVQMVEFSEIKCRPADAGYEPRCSDLGLPEGGTFEALPSGTCDANYVFREGVTDFLAGLFGDGGRATAPYGAYVSAAGSYRDGDHIAMFVDPASDTVRGFWRLYLHDGRIVAAPFSCADPLPAESDVGRWLVRPQELGHEPLRIPPTIPDQAGRFFNALASAGFDATPLPEVFTLPWLAVDGAPLAGHRLRVGETASAAFFDLRSAAAVEAVRELASGPLPAPLVDGARAIWVTDHAAVVLWDRTAFPEIEPTISFVLGEPLRVESAR